MRHRPTGQLHRGFEGDTVVDGLKITSITDNAVILEAPTGHRFIFQGRFPTH